ncbi:MAG: alpha/beta fold hydrolase [Myxococcota bacterium]
MTGLQKNAVTGPTGLIGRWLLISLTQRKLPVLALMRNANDRLPALQQWVQDHGGRGELIEAHNFDLMDRGLGLSPDARSALRQATQVYHLAARFQFGLSEEDARLANVSSTEKLVEVLAGGQIQRLVAISGYRTEGRPARKLDIDNPLSLKAFYRNHGAYEASKMEAHQRIARAAEHHNVPLTRISPASVIGDSQTGETTQYYGLAELFNDLWLGRLPILPGSADAWLPVIPVDVLAELLAEVHREPPGGHLVVLDERSPSLDTLVRWAAARMGVKPPAMRIPIPMIRALPRFISGVEPEALSFISADRYDTQPWMDAAARLGITIPPLQPALERWLDHLLDTRFGATPPRRVRATTSAGTITYAEGNHRRAKAVLLHGLPLTGRSWAPIADRLSIPTLIPDLPGLGRTPSGGGSLDEWLRGLLVDLDRPWLVGHSLGCAPALQLATQTPERIAGLVLISPFFLQARAGALMRQPWLVTQAMRRMTAERLTAMIGDDGDVMEDALAALRRLPTARAAARWLAWASRQHTRDQLRDALSHLQVPTLLIVGEQDPLTEDLPTEVGALQIPGTGHYPQLTHPDHIAQLIQEQITPLRKAQPSASSS